MNSNTLYGDWLVEWLDEKKGFVKEATYGNYSMAVVNHIYPTLGGQALCAIDERMMQETAAYWLENGRKDGKGGLAEKTVRDMVVIVKLSLHEALRKLKLPAESWRIKYPKRENNNKPVVLATEDQMKLIQSSLLDLNTRNAGILLALYTGIRIGELCALQWKDIDLAQGVLIVSKTMQRIYIRGIDGSYVSKVITTSPKTRSSAREIPLSSFIQPVLSKIKCSNDDAYIITGTADYLEPRSYRSYYNRYIQRIGIEHINFHGLRHSFATRLIEAGADVKTVSNLLGHASVSITLNLYVHPQMEQKRKCVELLQPFI